MATWNAAFEDTPSDVQPGSVIPDIVHELKGAVRERIALEHQMVVTETGNHGRHKLGSARVFVDDATVTDRAPIAPATASDNDIGRIHFKPTKRQLLVMGPPSIGQPNEWREVDYVHKDDDTAETIAGAKTFTIAPVVSETQLNGSAIVDGYATGKVPTIATMEARIAASTTAAIIEGIAIPVGYVYIQLKGRPNPWALWTSIIQSQWSDISADYAGKFLEGETLGVRSLGTDYAQTIPNHTHPFTVDANATGHDTGTDALGGSNHALNTGAQAHFTGATANPTGGDAVNRPPASIFKVWVRAS